MLSRLQRRHSKSSHFSGSFLRFRSTVVATFLIATSLLFIDVQSSYAESNDKIASKGAFTENLVLADVVIGNTQYNTKHKLQLAATSLAPASLVLSVRGLKDHTVRALILLDGELVVFPMQYFEKFQAYKVNFPTPVAKLSYRFQFISSSGDSGLSSEFQVSSTCESKELEAVLGSLSGERKKLIKAAIDSERNEGILINTLTSLRKLSAKGDSK